MSVQCLAGSTMAPRLSDDQHVVCLDRLVGDFQFGAPRPTFWASSSSNRIHSCGPRREQLQTSDRIDRRPDAGYSNRSATAVEQPVR